MPAKGYSLQQGVPGSSLAHHWHCQSAPPSTAWPPVPAVCHQKCCLHWTGPMLPPAMCGAACGGGGGSRVLMRSVVHAAQDVNKHCGLDCAGICVMAPRRIAWPSARQSHAAWVRRPHGQYACKLHDHVLMHRLQWQYPRALCRHKKSRKRRHSLRVGFCAVAVQYGSHCKQCIAGHTWINSCSVGSFCIASTNCSTAYQTS